VEWVVNKKYLGMFSCLVVIIVYECKLCVHLVVAVIDYCLLVAYVKR